VRFLIDHDVDVAVGKMLRRSKHEAWSAGEVGLAAAVDDDLSVWASAHGAAVISTDREFGQRRMKNAIGGHVWLVCRDWEATDLLSTYLDEVVPLLLARADITIRVSAGGLAGSSDWT
jgi:predicted nuclease of predicted toxin-antitoxin system